MESASVVNELRLAWYRWDRSSGDPTATSKMIDATIKVAEALQSDYRRVRAHMQAMRQQGYSIDQICERIATRLS